MAMYIVPIRIKKCWKILESFAKSVIPKVLGIIYNRFVQFTVRVVTWENLDKNRNKINIGSMDCSKELWEDV